LGTALGQFPNWSAANHRHGDITLLEDNVHDVLDCLRSALRSAVKHRADHQTIGLGVGAQSARLKRPRADTSGVIGVETQSAPNGLTDAYNVHRTQEHDRFQSRDVDTLSKNGMVKNHKLLVGILTPSVESVEEHLTIDLLTVNKGTVLSSDMKHRVSCLFHLLGKVRLRQKTNNMLGRLRTNQDFIHRIVLNDLKQILTVPLSDILTLHRETHRSSNHLRRNDITTLHQLRSRHLSDNLTIHIRIIHTRFEDRSRILRSCGEEIAAFCLTSKVFYGREEVTTNRVVCLVKVDSIYLNICLLKTMKRMIGGENQLVLVGTTRPVVNLSRFGGAEVVSLTRMNVKNSSSRDKLKILRTQLLCQQNAGRDHHNGLRGIRLKLTHGIKDTHIGLTAASGKHTDTFVVLGESVKCLLLVRTELNHRSHFVCIHNNPLTGKPQEGL